MLKNYRVKCTCNDDIGCRKQQKLSYHMFTMSCKFLVSYNIMSADHDIVLMGSIPGHCTVR